MTGPYRSDGAAEPVLAAFNGKIFAFDPESGRRIWSWDSGSSVTVRLGLDAGRVYALLHRRLACITLTGAVVFDVPTIAADTILVHDGFVFVGGAGEVACHSKDGTSVWQDELKGHGIGDVALAFKGKVAQADRQS